MQKLKKYSYNILELNIVHEYILGKGTNFTGRLYIEEHICPISDKILLPNNIFALRNDIQQTKLLVHAKINTYFDPLTFY